MAKIPFWKMSGAGNDFIIIDNRNGVAPAENTAQWVKNVCERRMSAGADGLVLVEDADGVDFKWRFYNSDGGGAEMCGNAARCVSRFAVLNGIAGEKLAFDTVAGRIEAEVKGERVNVRMTDPTDFRPEISAKFRRCVMPASSLNTGVPHVCIEVDDIENTDVVEVGREIRHHADFAPAGTNVNFYRRRDDGVLLNRTYERGVEDETLACGTGIVASALSAARRFGATSPVSVLSRSGGEFTIRFSRMDDGRFTDVYMEGDARIIYTGELWEEAWRR